MDAAADLFLENGNYLSSDDELDSCSPLIDLYIQDYGNNSVINVMTPFTFRKFEKLWDLVCIDFISGMTNGKGPNSTTKPKDVFFILLSVLKSPSGWDKVGLDFAMKGQKAQRIVQRAITVLAPLVKDLFVRQVNKDYFQEEGISECKYFPYVHHITDATVLEINRPAGTHSESKPYFSGEYLVYLYCVNIHYFI